MDNPLHQLGQTRSSHQPNHILLTPDTFVRTVLPGMKKAMAIVHISPALGAAFTAYTVEFEAGGELGSAAAQRFLYVLDGAIRVEAASQGQELGPRGYAFVPEGMAHHLSATAQSQVVVIEKQYHRLETAAAPQLMVSSEDAIASQPLGGDASLEVKCLLPDQPAFDFAVNTMTYQPGSSLSMVEMHIMEHGLIMLAGGGIYRLGDRWYPVTAGDFIWMGPWCPQWFGAIGKVPAKYLIYKDANRHPLVRL